MRHKLLLALILATNLLQAKNLEGRVGCGLSLLDFNHAPALSVRLHPSTHVATTLVVGFNTATNTSLTAVGGQIHRYTSLEENLNFFLGAAAYLLADKGGSSTLTTGIELDGLIGVEFFFIGLSNLGLQLQTGVGMRTLRSFALKVVGDGFAGFAFHYYF